MRASINVRPGASGAEGRRVIVCGGRDYADRDYLFTVLDDLHAGDPIGVIMHGDARGADTLAGEWAEARGVAVFELRADWKRHGRSAGPRRNARMLNAWPDLVVAFPGGDGTADMVRRAANAGLPVMHPAVPRTSPASPPAPGPGPEGA